MSFFTSLGIVILSTLIIAILQFRPAIFSIFYHYASGKYSRAKLQDLCFSFFFGSILFSALLFTIINIFLSTLARTDINFTNGILTWALIGILFALSLLSFFCYFRKGPGTELFISRPLAQNFLSRAGSAKTASDGFMLGFFSNFPEIFFTLPLYIIIFIELDRLSISAFSLAATLLTCILTTIIPLFIIYISYRSGYNLSDITKFRIKNKPFYRIFIGISYLTLVALIISFRNLL